MTTTATAAPVSRVLTSLHGREIGLNDKRRLVVKAEPDGFSFSAASGAANVCNMTIQVTDNEGNAVAGVFNFDYWLSDAATGAGLTASANTSEVTCSTGALLGVVTTEKAWRIQTDATGKAVVVHTDTGKSTTYPSAQVPGRSTVVVATQLAAANFG
jgi:hypothetical protein